MNTRIASKLGGALVLILALLTSACAIFTPPREKPVVEDNLGPKNDNDMMATLSLDASRRAVVAHLNRETLCAEPPPDIAESVARSIGAAISAGAKSGDIDADAALKLAYAYQTSVKQLSPLSQGVKFTRDSLFSLCQARLNWFLNNEDFYWLFVDVLTRGSILIAQEIPYLSREFDDSQATLDSEEAATLLDSLNQNETTGEPPDDASSGETDPQALPSVVERDN